MNKGSIEQIGTPAEIYDRPDTLYVAGFIGSPPMNVLPGQIAAARRGVMLEDGTLLPVASGLHLPDGALVHVGFRPEQTELVSAGQGSFDARLDMVEEMGAARLCNLLFDDIPITVVTEERPTLAAGATVGVRLAQRNMHLFDAGTGKRIDPLRMDALSPETVQTA
jgi:sn-glycerol 3-phosphate transport system ATP-binding protein